MQSTLKTNLLSKNIFFIFATAISFFVFFKNAWVTEDAYIIFRSVEQLFHGNGPVWNPHERVQVYTSHLWYSLIVLSRFASENLFLNVIFLSATLWLITLWVLKTLFKDEFLLLSCVLFLLASNGFYDYTSSGLENCLAYTLLSIYLYFYQKFFRLITSPLKSHAKIKQNIFIVLFTASLIICTRHDLVLLILPSALYFLYKSRALMPVKTIVYYSFVALLPLIFYTLFSLFYYGFPFPNTSYAKLNTGLVRSELLHQGMLYFYSSLTKDSITSVVIVIALILSTVIRNNPWLKYISFGLILNLLYVLFVGGDFMQGRFLSYAFFVSTILCFLYLKDKNYYKFKNLILFSIYLYLIFYNHTPLNSSFVHSADGINMGIADERGMYFSTLSLHKFLDSKKHNRAFPDIHWGQKARQFKEADDKVIVFGNIGVFGYLIGVEKIIIDPYAISDPLLSRLPSNPNWRIGHFKRVIPEGYKESLESGRAVISDPNINTYYENLKIVTQQENLFNSERLKQIFLFNTGKYDYLLKKKNIKP